MPEPESGNSEKMKLKLKSIGALLLSGVMMFAACDKYDDSALSGRVDDLEGRVTELEKLVADLNTTVSGLSTIVTAMQSEDRVKSVTPIMEGETIIGYTIEFTTSGTATIYNGEEPSLGVIEDGGILYWAVDGVLLTDGSNNRIPATIAPEFQVGDNGGLQYRINGGEWQDMPGSANIGLVRDVKQDGTESVTFILSDGREITIPMVQSFALELNVESTGIGIMANQRMTIDYTVVSGDENTLVKAISEGGYTVEVNATDATKGYLSITAPATLPDNATILVVAVNGKGEMTGKILSFEKGELTLVENTVTVGKDGGEITITIRTNMSYTATVDTGNQWIKEAVETKAMREDQLKYTVDPYDGTGSRTGYIHVSYGDGQSVTYTVVQTDATIVSGGKDDFETFTTVSSGINYVDPSATTTAGWKVNEYCMVISKETAGWDAVDGYIPFICGLTDQPGALTSPSLQGGCGTLKIQYGTHAAKSMNVGFGFTVTVSNGTDTQTFKVIQEQEEDMQKVIYEKTFDVNISGDFTVTFTNDCLYPHSVTRNKYKDAVGFLSVEWTGYSAN